MARKRLGWETKLYEGAPGAAAAVQVTNSGDIKTDFPIEYGDVTSRGAGTNIPRKDRGPVSQDAKIDFNMLVKDSDASLIALMAAAFNPVPTTRAIKVVNALGTTVFDGDCFIKVSDGAPLAGAATYDVECLATEFGGRAYLIYGL